jgi:hypothetical protein
MQRGVGNGDSEGLVDVGTAAAEQGALFDTATRAVTGCSVPVASVMPIVTPWPVAWLLSPKPGAVT